MTHAPQWKDRISNSKQALTLKTAELDGEVQLPGPSGRIDFWMVKLLAVILVVSDVARPALDMS